MCGEHVLPLFLFVHHFDGHKLFKLIPKEKCRFIRRDDGFFSWIFSQRPTFAYLTLCEELRGGCLDVVGSQDGLDVLLTLVRELGPEPLGLLL